MCFLINNNKLIFYIIRLEKDDSRIKNVFFLIFDFINIVL